MKTFKSSENQSKHRGGVYPDVRMQHVQAQELGTRDSENDYEPKEDFNSKGFFLIHYCYHYYYHHHYCYHYT